MKKTLIRLFTVALLLMVSLAAEAQYVSVNIEKGGDFGNGSITEKKDAQTKSADGNIVTVTLIVKPKSGYSIDPSAIEVYETISPQTVYPNGTRANDVTLGKRLDVKCDVKSITKETECTVDVASNLGVWVEKAEFLSGSKGNRGVTISSGYYYLENKQNNEGYFLVPAGGTGTVKYFNNNEETPYLTSYKKSKETETDKINNFIWYIEKVTDGDNTYYRFRHLLTGRYVVVNGMVETNNPTRLRLHLEAQLEPDENTLFVIEENTSDNTLIGIRHKSVYATHTNGSQYWWWDVADGNKDNYSQGDSKGLLCFWNEKTGNNGLTKWAKPTAIETDKMVCLPPVISYDSGTGKVTISSYEGFNDVTYYYTTDGTEPTTSSTPYSGTPFDMPSGKTVVKAIAKRGDFQNTTVTTFNIEQCATPIITAGSDGTYSVTCATAEVTFYYTTDGTTPTTTSTSNTTGSISLPLDLDGEFLRVIAAKTSGDGSDASPAALYYIPQCAKPTITNSNGTISMATATERANIYYTKDGSDPSTTNTKASLYSESYSYTITQGAHTIKARAIKAGYSRSEQVSLEYSKCSTPVLANPYDGTVTITCGTSGASVYYTTNGNEPKSNGTNDSQLYSAGAITLPEGTTIATIKARAFKLGNGQSDILTYTVPISPVPNISLEGNTLTITCDVDDANIYYSFSESGSDWTLYSTPLDVSSHELVRCYTGHAGYLNSADVSYRKPSEIHNSSAISSMNGSYLLASDFTWDSPLGTASAPFTGTLDGQFNTISGSGPLVAYAKDATIKNIIIRSASVSGGVNAGAICNEADGSTKIYNCGVLGGSVSGSGAVGGLVGLIKAGSKVRVVNCFNYANVSGGTHAAGIVGRNDGTVDKTSVTNVRIALCMMYGNITGGTTISPVYVGSVAANEAAGILENTHQTNVKQFTEYNYYLYSTDKDVLGNRIEKIPYTAYNDQIAIDKEDYLTRFPFYRHILNTHRELASYFLFGDYTSGHIAEIGHWVLDKSKANYPIIEKWQSNTYKTTKDIKNNLPTTGKPYEGNLLSDQGTSGYLKVNYTIGTVTGSLDLPITDMDTLRYDFTWGKVVLPFANEIEGWRNKTDKDYSKVITGWKITSVTKDGTSYNSSSVTNYNFADRDNPQKDIYDANNPYIFAQGGNYIVPYKVTAIFIEANFANAKYLSDPAYDMGYDSNYNTATQLGGAVSGSYHGQTVYTSLSTLVSGLSKTNNPHDQAIVLVGNFHYNMKTLGSAVLDGGKAVTIMSVDEDCNQEPDYGWYSYMNTSRPVVPPLRFDFVPNIPMGMSSHVTGSTINPGVSIWKAKGWFELTETCVSLMHQCEIDSKNFGNEDGKGNNRWIANSGYFTQIVRSKDGACTKLSYIQIGGNAYVKELYPGNHSTTKLTNKVVPIVVTGGEIEECCMTGYHVGGKLEGDNIYFWSAGGKIQKFLGAYMETPVQASGHTGGVNMNASIDHARIWKFFGGGTSNAATITGNINVTINNSFVDFYCGGPEFGDMVTGTNGKTVTTNATGTTFRKYYGAGYGGTSLTNVFINENPGLAINNLSNNQGKTVFPQAFTFYTDNRLKTDDSYGIGTAYKFEYIINSTGDKVVPRWYIGRARFSLATTGNVINNLTNCIIEGDFYGAGCQGKVDGTVSSTLNGCIIKRSVFGGGYKATNNAVKVYPTTQPTYSYYHCEKGLFSGFGAVEPEMWEWKQGASTNETWEEGILYTQSSITLTDLGNVTGEITLTIDGGYVGGTSEGMTPATAATATTEAIPEGGNVYGGGNESKSLNNTIVTLKGDAYIYGNVFGGGNKGIVSGSTEVNIE